MEKYMLDEKWTFWYDYHVKKKAGQDDWKQNLNKICTISDIPTLLYAVESMESLENWPSASNIHFFKENIQPAWEDRQNIEGGKWILEFNKSETSVNLTNVWTRTVAMCISNIIKDGVICGCVFSPRKFVNRFSVWTSKKDNNVIEVGKLWKENVKTDKYKELSFRVHKDALQGGNFWNKSLYNL